MKLFAILTIGGLAVILLSGAASATDCYEEAQQVIENRDLVLKHLTNELNTLYGKGYSYGDDEVQRILTSTNKVYEECDQEVSRIMADCGNTGTISVPYTDNVVIDDPLIPTRETPRLYETNDLIAKTARGIDNTRPLALATLPIYIVGLVIILTVSLGINKIFYR
jgi:hypothetical protein